MKTASKGARGREVRFLQVVLNTHLQRRPNLRVDGIFGDRTESAVQDFQKFAGLAIDGVVGTKTWKSLLVPAKVPAPNLRKFRSAVGTVSDFVEHLHKLEKKHHSTREVLDAVSDFSATSNGSRYLLSSRNPHVIDFRHFFAAASEAYGGSISRRIGIPIGGTRGGALLLGVANELSQCIDEGLRLKLNSCFSREDLGSNRLGAEFGRSIAMAQSEAGRGLVHQQLQRFLNGIGAQPPKAIGNIQLPSRGNTGLESLGAIVIGLLDILVPDAY